MYDFRNKTRKELRRIQCELFPGSTLPQICLSVRMGINGSGDPIDDLRIKDIEGFLQAVEFVWEPSLLKQEKPIDDAVKDLVSATRAYIHRHFLESQDVPSKQ